MRSSALIENFVAYRVFRYCGVVAIALSFSCQQVLAYENELGWTLDSVLKQLNRQTKDFQTALARVTISWNDPDQGPVTRSGVVYLNAKGQSRFVEVSPSRTEMLLRDNTVYLYDPVRAIVEEFSTRKHKERLEPFTLLGFSTTGKDLQDDFLVTMLGEDVGAERRALVLELTPKKEETRSTVSRIRLWIDQASWMPVRQEIEHIPGGMTLHINYRAMARNLDLTSDLFRAKWPKGTSKIKR